LNKFQKTLMQLAYDNYKKTGEAVGVSPGNSGDEIFYYSTALDLLFDEEYAVPEQEDYDPDKIYPRLRYELTEKGLEYARTNLAD
jgi:hypothetical protein